MKTSIFAITAVIAATTADASELPTDAIELTYNLEATNSGITFDGSLANEYATVDFKVADNAFETLNLSAAHTWAFDDNSKIDMSFAWDAVTGETTYAVNGSTTIEGVSATFELGKGEKDVANISLSYELEGENGYSIGASTNLLTGDYKFELKGAWKY